MSALGATGTGTCSTFPIVTAGPGVEITGSLGSSETVTGADLDYLSNSINFVDEEFGCSTDTVFVNSLFNGTGAAFEGATRSEERRVG